MLQSKGDPDSAGAHVEQQSFRSPHQHPPRAARWPARHRMRGLLPSIRHLAVRPGLNDGWSVHIKEVKGLTTNPHPHEPSSSSSVRKGILYRFFHDSGGRVLGSASLKNELCPKLGELHTLFALQKYEINVNGTGQIIWSWVFEEMFESPILLSEQIWVRFEKMRWIMTLKRSNFVLIYIFLELWCADFTLLLCFGRAPF